MNISKSALSTMLLKNILKSQQQHFKPAPKVNPFFLINKIQQAKPSYKSNLINKQIAYDVIIDTQQTKTEKIKNCICAARPNSQIYKRISKQFLYNLKNKVNQLLFFGGRQVSPRLQTSIGLSSNPGLFMIAAIAILDQKYKQNHQRCDVEFSFLQFRQGQIYDLINYTEIPLNMQEKADQNIVGFNQQFVKVFTFLQFIKLFKIALFNNKQRDFKTQTTFKQNKQLKSTFIMKVRTKQFNNEGELISQQQTALVDYDEGCFKTGKQKQGKNLFDYLLIQINNSNPNNKPVHYHMVQKNLFINFFKRYLRIPLSKQSKKDDEDIQHKVGGQLIFINSISSNKQEYPQNSVFLESIYASAGQQWQAKVFQSYRWNNYFNSQFVNQKFSRIIDSIFNKNYSTLSQFYQAKQFYNEQVKKLKFWIKQYKNVINSYFVLKREFKCLQNVNIGFQLQLIGSCIKSDNFKDFYSSKSYISLGRQIVIKTQNIKSQIMACSNEMLKIKNDILALKKKDSNGRIDTIIPQIIKSMSVARKSTKENKNPQNKFKPLLMSDTIHVEFNQLEAFSAIKTHIFQYLYQIWDKVNISDQRTLVQDLIFQQSFSEQLQNIVSIFGSFIQRMQKIQQNQISCHKGDLILSRNNFYQLVKSFNLTKQSFLKSAKLNYKHLGKENPLTDKNMRNSHVQLPKLKTNYKKMFTQANLNKLQDKSNALKNNKDLMQVKGKIDFAKMIINPCQL